MLKKIYQMSFVLCTLAGVGQSALAMIEAKTGRYTAVCEEQYIKLFFDKGSSTERLIGKKCVPGSNVKISDLIIKYNHSNYLVDIAVCVHGPDESYGLVMGYEGTVRSKPCLIFDGIDLSSCSFNKNVTVPDLTNEEAFRETTRTWYEGKMMPSKIKYNLGGQVEAVKEIPINNASKEIVKEKIDGPGKGAKGGKVGKNEKGAGLSSANCWLLAGGGISLLTVTGLVCAYVWNKKKEADKKAEDGKLITEFDEQEAPTVVA